MTNGQRQQTNIYILLKSLLLRLHLILNAVPDVASVLRDATEVRSAVVTLQLLAQSCASDSIKRRRASESANQQASSVVT
jgi:hypothetical protein